MSRVGRVRFRKREFIHGSLQSRFSAESAVRLEDNSETGQNQLYMEDTHGRPIVDSEMSSYGLKSFKVETVGGDFSNEDGTQYAHVTNFYPSRIRGDLTAYYPFDWPYGIGTAPVSFNEMMARTNPNRPDYVVGTLLQDLWDLPRILKSIGDLLRSGRSAIGAQGVANHALAAKFGWVPLFDDISKLLQVKKNVARRNEELRRLFANGGIKRRIRLAEVSNFPTSTNVAIDSGFPLGMNGKLEVFNKEEIWAVLNWQNQSDFSCGHPSDEERLALAQKLVLGISASGSFASSWDLIPWTWLLGWVTDIRAYVLAHGNTVPVKLSGKINVMWSITQTRSLSRTTFARSEFSGGSGDTVWSGKYRKVYDPPSTPTSFLPHITADRLSTLALLAVQRLR